MHLGIIWVYVQGYELPSTGMVPSQTPPRDLRPPHHPTRSSLSPGPHHRTPRTRGPPPPPSSCRTAIFEFKVACSRLQQTSQSSRVPARRSRFIRLYPSSPVATSRQSVQLHTQWFPCLIYTVVRLLSPVMVVTVKISRVSWSWRLQSRARQHSRSSEPVHGLLNQSISTLPVSLVPTNTSGAGHREKVKVCVNYCHFYLMTAKIFFFN